MAKNTEEQQGVIDSSADTLVVNAFAGTGKTTTLVGFAKERPSKRMLYLAFNKSVAEEAKARFPSNVDAKTSHALAFPGFGSRYKDKLGNPRAFHARNFLRLRMNGDDALVLSGLALEAVNRYLISADEDLIPGHVRAGQALAKGFSQDEVFEAATRLWEAMKDPHVNAVPMPHDGYLKLYQLSEPDLGKYDYILLDEAQDTNPCLFKVFSSQSTGRVLVGDEHQNIYTFRGAMNAMKRMRGERHALTSSFRFGQPIAEVANAILGVFKEEELRLRGLGGPSNVGRPQDDLKTVYLHRTNAGLFDRAVDLLHTGARMHFVGGVKNYNFETILDAWRIMDGDHRSIRDPFMKSFQTIGDLEAYAEAVGDREIQARLKVVKKYTFRIPRLLERLEGADEPDASKANASLTTAHKSKGLEWDQVVLGEDFPDLMHDGKTPLVADLLPPGVEADPLGFEEANLIYVAATRARKNLVPTEQLAALMGWVQRNGLPQHAALKS